MVGKPVKKWRMQKKCDNCPFAKSGKGLQLRKGLGPGRWAGILNSLRQGNYFPCHKTTEQDDETGEHIPGVGLVCAGSLEWSEKNGASSAYVRLCTYMEKKENGKESRSVEFPAGQANQT